MACFGVSPADLLYLTDAFSSFNELESRPPESFKADPKYEILDSSFLRALRDFFSKILDVWKSCHHKPYELSTDATRRISQPELDGFDALAVRKFSKPSLLGYQELNLFLSKAKLSFDDGSVPLKDKIELYNELIPLATSSVNFQDSSAIKDSLPDADGKIIAIPLVIAGKFRKHIVTFVVDPTNKTIEFYDSKGLSIKDRASAPIDMTNDIGEKNHLKLLELFKILNEKYKGFKVVENTHKHQKDFYNCGVYVLDYIKRRVGGESAKEIQESGKSFSEIEATKQSFFKSFLESVTTEPSEGSSTNDGTQDFTDARTQVLETTPGDGDLKITEDDFYLV